MKRYVCQIVLLCLFNILFCTFHIALSSSFTLNSSLKTEEASPAEVTGRYTLILYGSRFADDIETIAILDAEGDQYTFEPYAPDFDYKIQHGISAKKALSSAEEFVGFHHAFRRSQLSKIIDNTGKVIGYELRPLYQIWTYGVSDVMDVHYWLEKPDKIKVTIRLVPSVERSRFPGGDHRSSGRH
jgi:hypothetical protein